MIIQAFIETHPDLGFTAESFTLDNTKMKKTYVDINSDYATLANNNDNSIPNVDELESEYNRLSKRTLPNGLYMMFSITVNNKQVFIGYGSCFVSAANNIIGISYFLLPKYRSKGYGKKIVQFLVHIITKWKNNNEYNLGTINKIEAITTTENTASQKVLLHNKFIQDQKPQYRRSRLTYLFTLEI